MEQKERKKIPWAELIKAVVTAVIGVLTGMHL